MTPEIQQDSHPGRVEARAKRALPHGVITFVIAIVATIAFIAIALRVVEGRFDALDRQCTLALHAIDTDVLDQVMILFTEIGSGLCLSVVIVLVALLAVRRRLWPLGVLLAANATLESITNVLLKAWFVRARPYLFADEVARPHSWSFPSGHAMSAMAAYGAVAAVLIGLYPRARWPIVGAATFLIAGIGMSRVYLGVHWTSDVLAGYAAGVPFVVVTVHLVHRLLNRKPANAG